MASLLLSYNNELPDVTYILHDFQTPIFICLVGSIVTILVLFIDVFERVYNWLRIEAIDRLDIESGQLALSSADNVDWSHEPMTHNILRVLEIFNRFMAYFSERQDLGLRPEFLEQVSPCVSYKNMGETTLGECVICLEGFEDDEMCRVFPVCNHVFHSDCLDSWMRNHLTCPVCRNCIVDCLRMTT
ncbi:hypothetical protein V6N13_117635 [Hibiscus sabdariffa]|uniref:RING-type E3 ubiquitin transferase n=1 Tax=Hibiscus sabdariffa TaxID=183260 RepID=A0ABR2PB52_9ROSI